MLKIQQALQNDSNGVYRDELERRFHAESVIVEGKLNAGVCPDDYHKLNLFMQTTRTATSVVREYWLHTHRQN